MPGTMTAEEIQAAYPLVALALTEDLGTTGDRTSLATISPTKQGRAAIVSRVAGVLAGMPVVQLVIAAVDPELKLEIRVAEGDRFSAQTTLGVVSGPTRSLLTAERTLLNFLQRMCGVATLTRQYRDAIGDLPTLLLDTRKTLPGWRRLDKYSVRQGGGTNHRMGLYDAILIKDNHIAEVGKALSPVAEAVQRARSYPGNAGLPVEVEVDSLDQLREVLPLRPEIILLDNMTLEQLRQAKTLRDQVSPQTQLEASGGVNLRTIRGIAETGVDRISVGAITHSAPALDIGLDDLPDEI